jgi:hypothetical protein
MCPHPDNGFARASDPLSAHLGQEQRLMLQGAQGAPGKLPTAWTCRMPTAAAFFRVSSAMWVIVRVWPLQGGLPDHWGIPSRVRRWCRAYGYSRTRRYHASTSI